MSELGETENPRELIKGNPGAVEENARVLRARAERAEDAANGLRAIDSGSWEGTAAKAFHDKFSYEPGKWTTAATALEAGATALDNYSRTLRWGHGQAGEAIHLWNEGEQATQQAQVQQEGAATDAAARNQPPPPFADPGGAYRQAARDMLNRARTQVSEAGDIAAGILRGETESAPEESSWLQDFGAGVADAGANMVNGAASFGNAMLNHPGEMLVAAGGAGLTAVSAAGEVAGVALDATGVGAVAGGPLNALSAAGMATGVGITGAAAASMASHAAGDDHVEPIDTSDDDAADDVATTEETTSAEPPREITGFRQHGEDQAYARDGGRGVSDEAINDAVENPTRSVETQTNHEEGMTYKYRGKDAVVVLNEQGEVVTTYAKGSAGWRNNP